MYVVVQWARSVICHTIYFLPTAPQLNELFFPSFKFFLGGYCIICQIQPAKPEVCPLKNVLELQGERGREYFYFLVGSNKGRIKGVEGEVGPPHHYYGRKHNPASLVVTFFVCLFIFIIIIISSLSIERKKHLKN